MASSAVEVASSAVEVASSAVEVASSHAGPPEQQTQAAPVDVTSLRAGAVMAVLRQTVAARHRTAWASQVARLARTGPTGVRAESALTARAPRVRPMLMADPVAAAPPARASAIAVNRALLETVGLVRRRTGGCRAALSRDVRRSRVVQTANVHKGRVQSAVVRNAGVRIARLPRVARIGRLDRRVRIVRAVMPNGRAGRHVRSPPR